LNSTLPYDHQTRRKQTMATKKKKKKKMAKPEAGK